MKQRVKAKASRNKNGRVSKNGSAIERSERLGQGTKNAMRKADMSSGRQESRWT